MQGVAHASICFGHIQIHQWTKAAEGGKFCSMIDTKRAGVLDLLWPPTGLVLKTATPLGGFLATRISTPGRWRRQDEPQRRKTGGEG